ncbi:MAG: TIGR03936 family radical SAM-associated protein [Candidatus Omnitrophica bacterium]|nr:TIGR03936 family radical SAM-associated protein [Candidatus Omnitrophota bacterium]MDD5488385.1 TIGR03936 family radical SAM-associated protein [Candidatus Omnitrophota bacterium]
MVNADSMNTKYKADFGKKGQMVFISHLDLMTLFRRALRRSGLPLVFTEGFTPRVKISMPKALKLGVESDHEELVFWLKERVREEEVLTSLRRQVTQGIDIHGLTIDK